MRGKKCIDMGMDMGIDMGMDKRKKGTKDRMINTNSGGGRMNK